MAPSILTRPARRVSALLSLWREARERHGARAATVAVIDELGRRSIGLTVNEVVTLEVGDVNVARPAPAGFEFRFLDADEVARFEADPSNELEGMAERARAGHDLCFGALDGALLAAYGWYALGSVEGEHCDGVALSFPPDVAYMYKGFTHPDYRGKRLHGYVMGLALEALHEERGVERLVSTISWANNASLKSSYRLGYHTRGRLFAIRRFAHLASAPRAARRMGLRTGRHADLGSRRQPRGPALDGRSVGGGVDPPSGPH